MQIIALIVTPSFCLFRFVSKKLIKNIDLNHVVSSRVIFSKALSLLRLLLTRFFVCVECKCAYWFTLFLHSVLLAACFGSGFFVLFYGFKNN